MFVFNRNDKKMFPITVAFIRFPFIDKIKPSSCSSSHWTGTFHGGRRATPSQHHFLLSGFDS